MSDHRLRMDRHSSLDLSDLCLDSCSFEATITAATARVAAAPLCGNNPSYIFVRSSSALCQGQGENGA